MTVLLGGVKLRPRIRSSRLAIDLSLWRPLQKVSESLPEIQLIITISLRASCVILIGRGRVDMQWDARVVFDYDWRTDFGSTTMVVDFKFKYNDVMLAF